MAKKWGGMFGSTDWRNAEHYPDPRSTSLDAWAWQFLRRNADFEKAMKSLDALQGQKNDPNSPFRKRWGEIQDKFGIAHYLHPEWGFDSPVKFKRAPYRIPTATIFATGKDVFIAPYEEWGIAMLFDLRQSIEKQIAAAKVTLKLNTAERERLGLSPLPRTQRNRNPDYRAMLRVLDGLDAGASVATIATALFPGRKSARDLVKVLRAEAERLRDGGYRYLTILLSPGK